jgi:hypothetical protein
VALTLPALATPIHSEASNDYLKGGLMPIALPTRRFLPTRPTQPTASRHRTFGLRNPTVPDGTVTAVFSYMTNDELYNTSLVCNAWAALAMDSDVWNWDGVGCAALALPPAIPFGAHGANPGRGLALCDDPGAGVGVGAGSTAASGGPSLGAVKVKEEKDKGGKGTKPSAAAGGGGTKPRPDARGKHRAKKH